MLQSPIEQQIGELNVDRFPCDFTDYELIYQHFGRSQPREDRISMQGTIFFQLSILERFSPKWTVMYKTRQSKGGKLDGL